MFKLGVLVSSDSGHLGKRIDESGKLIIEIFSKHEYEIVDYIVVPDERALISENLIRMADILKADLILTSGGTGLSQRDITPEATMDVIERNVPGIPEAMRYKSLEITPKAMLSRSVAGIRKETLIINLPGSPKAVMECIDVIIPVLPHALQILKGVARECARE